MTREEILSRVRRVLVEALMCQEDQVQLDTSLIDDLGAESIDLLDIVFRIEREFDLKVTDRELYRGSLNLFEGGFVMDGKVTEEGLALIRERFPQVDLARFGPEVRQHELPRLITVGTIVNFLEELLARQSSGNSAES